MANTSSARKAHRVEVRRRVFNVRRKKAMASSMKEVTRLISAKSAKEAEALLPKAFQAIDKAAKRGVIKKNNAARTKSRLVAQIKKIS